MKLIDQLGLDATQRQWMGVELYRRAAQSFEQVKRYRDAAECWERAGDTERAVQVLLQHHDCAQAARMLWDRGRYREALDCYRRWLEQAEAGDVEAAVGAHLGIAACMHRLGEASDQLRQSYREARMWLEADDAILGAARGRCWRALGEYGSRVGRWDVMQLGYEMSLCLFEGYVHDQENALREYLVAAEGNRLLVQRLREQLAEVQAGGKRYKPEGKALKTAAERIRELRCFKGDSSNTLSVSFSPNGAVLASGCDDGSVRIWNLETRQEWQHLQANGGEVRSVSFSSNGSLLASGNIEGMVQLWEVETGQECRRFEGHTERVSSVSFCPDGALLASGGWDSTIRLWDVETGQEWWCWEEHYSWITCVSFSPDGTLKRTPSSRQK